MQFANARLAQTSDTLALQPMAAPAALAVTANPSVQVTEDIASAVTGIAFSGASSDMAVSASFLVSAGSLSAASSGGVTVRLAIGSTVVVEGTIADINAFIAAGHLTYTTPQDTTLSTYLAIQVLEVGQAASGDTWLDVAPVNDAPTVQAPDVLGVRPGAPTGLSGFSFDDVDGGSGVFVATLSVPAGTLAATGTEAVAVGGAPTALTLTGTLDEINAFIADKRVLYTTAPGATGDVTLSLSIDDQGNVGTGGALSGSASTTLRVLNEAPQITLPATLNAVEDTALALTQITLSDADGDDTVVVLNLGVGIGSLRATSAADIQVAGNNTGAMTLTGTVAQLNAYLGAGNLQYVPEANTHGVVPFAALVSDGVDSTQATSTIELQSVEDLPLISLEAPLTGTEDTPITLQGFAFADPGFDAGDDDAYTVTFSQGSFAATAGGGVTVGGTSTALTLTGTFGDLKVYLDEQGVQYTPPADVYGDITFSAAVTPAGTAATSDNYVFLQVFLDGVNDAPELTLDSTVAVTPGEASAVTGIVIADVDAGTNAIEATFAPARGTLFAEATADVHVTIDRAGIVQLSGTVEALNAFIAAGHLLYTGEANDMGRVTLTVSLDDLGYSGNGGGLSASGSLELVPVAAPQPEPEPDGGSGAPVPPGVARVGTAGDDTLTGTAGNDTFDARAGRDTIILAGGQDQADGGAGIDTVVFAGDRDDWTVERTGDGAFIVSNTAGDRAVLQSIERLQFDDVKLAMDLTPAQTQIARLYAAALDRAPDEGGLEFYVDAVEDGWSLARLARAFVNSPEYQQEYGGTSDTQFLTLLYQNAFGRAPDAVGLAFQLDVLAHDTGLEGRAHMLAAFIAAPETQVQLAGQAEQGVALYAA